MRIAVIGPGAMGLLYGGYLSRHHAVTLIGNNAENISRICKEGVVIEEPDGQKETFRPDAVCQTQNLPPFDLVILFVKSVVSEQALKQVQNIIGRKTLLMTLQNGMGHESLLEKYADAAQVIVGTTLEGSFRTAPNAVMHSGKGGMVIGAVTGSSARFQELAQLFEQCGFPCETSDNVRQMIWSKLMINASSSVLSGILQVPQGFVVENAAAWELCKKLIREICATAAADGYPFDPAEQIQRIYRHLKAAPTGYTSIYADLKAGRKTEVRAINGAVVETARRLCIAAPVNESVYALVQALEAAKPNGTAIKTDGSDGTGKNR